jgi:predicted membrane GTPase involved in stress response
MIFSFADEQLEFPVLYASAKEGWVSRAYTKCTEGEERTVAPLMDAIVEHVAAPHGDLHAPFRMLVNLNPQFLLARFNSDMQFALPVCILSSVF